MSLATTPWSPVRSIFDLFPAMAHPPPQQVRAARQWPSVKESSYSDKKSPFSGLRAGARGWFFGRRFRRVIYSSISISASWIFAGASGLAARAACSRIFR